MFFLFFFCFLCFSIQIRKIAIPTDKNEIDLTKKHSLDEAIALTGNSIDKNHFISVFCWSNVLFYKKENGKFHFFIVIFSGIVLMGATIENISVSFVLPYANCDLHLTTTEQGLVSSIGKTVSIKFDISTK